MRTILTALWLLAICGASQGHAACVQPWTMLESAEMRAEHYHGTAAMVQGPMALRITAAVNSTGDPTDYRGDTLIIWSEPDLNGATVAFVLNGCGTGEAAVFSTKAFGAVLVKAYPRHKTEWQPL